MSNWRTQLQYDPIPALLESGNEAISLFARRDLLNKPDLNVESLWSLPVAQRIIRKQRADGSWRYPGGNKTIRTEENYNQLETFRNVGYLVEMYGFDRSNPVITKAAEFLFNFQTRQGDIRGILGNQYTPYYTAAITELLIKAGYGQDPRVAMVFVWLADIRQDDGGWAIPLRTRRTRLDVISMERSTIEPDRTMPFSHLVTGVVLRAYAAHPSYRHSTEARLAGKLLLSRLFEKDAYPDRNTPDYWLRFSFPFWFTDLISAMDSLSIIGFSRSEPQIERAIQWFIRNQDSGGLWKLKVLKNPQFSCDLWLSLAICRILKRLHS